ncbi:L-iditol 2-dehydrogenase [Halomonas sabkhae]|uniref:L-iditol 2-dehydrogenase n=1 Tax=Halomonas sabkhae TaxID=626223 RepID=UPI0025B4209F|nr:L-iditol 2-dehydrogenase [Halomonas sabkhae]MDN3526520.1 L-iditol 2-dehydrogenase [Halomonas sabkhae]
MKLADKVAVITGGAKGIGLAIAGRYLTEGARVVIADVDARAIDEGLNQLGDDDRTLGLSLDVRYQASIDAMVVEVLEHFGRIDILVNNAAVFDMAPVLEVEAASFDRQFDVNVKGLFFTLQAVARVMVEHGQGGAIINMASQAGRRGEALVSTYCATKAAVISLTQSCALGLVEHGIRVNAIAPGVVDTPMWAEVDALFARYEGRPAGEKKRLVGEAVPMGRMGRPEDYAGAAAFLASDDSDYIVAQTLNVDGGNWMS